MLSSASTGAAMRAAGRTDRGSTGSSKAATIQNSAGGNSTLIVITLLSHQQLLQNKLRDHGKPERPGKPEQQIKRRKMMRISHRGHCDRCRRHDSNSNPVNPLHPCPPVPLKIISDAIMARSYRWNTRLGKRKKRTDRTAVITSGTT